MPTRTLNTLPEQAVPARVGNLLSFKLWYAECKITNRTFHMLEPTKNRENFDRVGHEVLLGWLNVSVAARKLYSRKSKSAITAVTTIKIAKRLEAKVHVYQIKLESP